MMSSPPGICCRRAGSCRRCGSQLAASARVRLGTVDSCTIQAPLRLWDQNETDAGGISDPQTNVLANCTGRLVH